MHLQTTKPRARLTGGTWQVYCSTQGVFIATPDFDAAVKLYYEAVLDVTRQEWSK